MANPTEFKDRELAMMLSGNLLRNEDGTLEVGTEILPDQDGNDRQVTVVYGIKGEGEIVPLEEVTLNIFLRNDIEGGPKQEPYPALRYGRNPKTRRNGPMEQRYLAEDLLKLEQKWTSVTNEHEGKESSYFYGLGSISPVNNKNLSDGFMVDYDSIETSVIPFDAATHFSNTDIVREQHWARIRQEKAQAAAAPPPAHQPGTVPEPPPMDMVAPVMENDGFSAA